MSELLAERDATTTRPYVRPDVQAVLDFAAANPGPAMADVGPEAARAMMKELTSGTDLPPRPLAVKRDFTIPGPAGSSIPARLFGARAERAPGPVVVFFHGGGFVLGDIDCYNSACAEISHVLDLPVVAVDYRLAPEHAWPAAPDDCEAAARWVASNGGEIGREATGLVLIGDSAGGGLTLVATIDLRDRPAAVPVIAQWAVYPVTDIYKEHGSYESFASGYMLDRPTLRWFWDCYGADRQHPRASPVFDTHEGIPPTLVSTASLDPLRDEGRAYAAALALAGRTVVLNEAAGMIHGFLGFRQITPSAQKDVPDNLALLQQLITQHNG